MRKSLRVFLAPLDALHSTVRAQKTHEILHRFLAKQSSNKFSCLEAVQHPLDASHVVVAGGDGSVLEVMHELRGLSETTSGAKRVVIPAIYPVNAGSVGFLANANWVLQDERGDRLESSLTKAERVNLAPLKVHATSVDGAESVLYAFNEVSLLRQSMQSAHLRICVNHTTRLSNLVADGVLLATSAGSSAYNYSAGGPVLPLKAQLLALTPLSPFRPRRWKGAVLPKSSSVTMHVLDHAKRPVLAGADSWQLRDVTRLHVAEDPSMSVPLLFDPKKTLEDRIFREMFE